MQTKKTLNSKLFKCIPLHSCRTPCTPLWLGLLCLVVVNKIRLGNHHMPICSYEFHRVGLLNTLLWIIIFYSEWMQVIYLYVRQCGLVFPLNSNCLIFYSAEWTLIPKIHSNTQNLYLPGLNQASQRSMGGVWITVSVHSNRLKCTDYSYGMFFLHHKFDFKRQSKINSRKHTQWSQLRLTVCKHKRGKYQHTQTQSTCRCMLSS